MEWNTGSAVRSLLWRALLATLGWWIISEGKPSLLPIGLVAVAGAVALSLYLAPQSPPRVRPLGLLIFIGYFLGRSVMAGFDVAYRILRPSRVDPVLEPVALSLPPGPPRWILANTLSLLPGTLSVAFEGDVLVLHCLSPSDGRAAAVRALEERIAGIFGLPLEAPQ